LRVRGLSGEHQHYDPASRIGGDPNLERDFNDIEVRGFIPAGPPVFSDVSK
jgi:hypothetical protein